MDTGWVLNLLSHSGNSLAHFLFGTHVDRGYGPWEKLGPRGGAAGRGLREPHPGPDPLGPGQAEINPVLLTCWRYRKNQAIKKGTCTNKSPDIAKVENAARETAGFQPLNLKGSLGTC